ncbi:MAG: TlyA family RNA methyltransferase [Actinobacteria bacterium]|nr:TlyA family RNA methyltransferase [Actinomycetota bacterium]
MPPRRPRPRRPPRRRPPPRRPRPPRWPPTRPRAETAPASRRPLDAELVRRGICADRGVARVLIERGEVLVGGAPATNVARLVTASEPLVVTGPPPRYVGRGGHKLEAALARFGIDLAGRRVLDAGSSTGGFTDCALQAGAREVVAVDAGRGQLHQRLRADPRVDVHERTNVRTVDAAELGGAAEVVVADLSFVSLRVAAPALLGLAAPGADLVWLVKPQFEAERGEVSAGGGVVSDPAIWRRTLRDVGATLEGAGAAIMGAMASPLRGADGNVEFLLHALAPGHPAVAPPPLHELVAAAVAAVPAEPT